MLAYYMSVFRQQNDGSAPAQASAKRGVKLASWQCQYRGGDWLDALVAQRLAVQLQGGGYPSEYTARAEHVLPRIRAGQPPHMNEPWWVGEGDILVGGVPQNTFDTDATDACRPQEWLFIVVWDES